MHTLNDLRDKYYWSQLTAKLEGFNIVMHANWDGRVTMLSLPVADHSEVPPPQASFLLNKQLLETLAKESQDGQLSDALLRDICLHSGNDAVRNAFAADALNDVNASYYQSDIAFDERAGLATLYARNRPLNLAIGRLLAQAGRRSESAAPGRLRVKELCSGNNTAHWRSITKGAVSGGATQLDIVLSDFFIPVIQRRARTRQNTIRAESYSLFDVPPRLPADQRFDAIITSYGFDSVWLPGDLHVVHAQSQWYQELYRVKIADWHPFAAALLHALRRGAPLPGAKPADYDGITVERMLRHFDVSAHPYSEIISSYPKQHFNIPGGIVSSIVANVENQLSQHGIFVSFDMGNFGFRNAVRPLSPYAKSGVAAFYQPGEYVLAKQILEQKYGLRVRLLSLAEFVDGYLGPAWRRRATEIETYQIEHSPTNGLMIVHA
jgi:hypothetical protein